MVARPLYGFYLTQTNTTHSYDSISKLLSMYFVVSLGYKDIDTSALKLIRGRLTIISQGGLHTVRINIFIMRPGFNQDRLRVQ